MGLHYLGTMVERLPAAVAVATSPPTVSKSETAEPLQGSQGPGVAVGSDPVSSFWASVGGRPETPTTTPVGQRGPKRVRLGSDDTVNLPRANQPGHAPPLGSVAQSPAPVHSQRSDQLLECLSDSDMGLDDL